MIKHFYDTCSLLNSQDLFKDDLFIISSTSLLELESIKTSGTKDDITKFNARNIIRQLNLNDNKYQVIVVDNDIDDIIKSYDLPINNDNRIVACAYRYNRDVEPIVFYTDDLCCKVIAKNIFKLDVKSTTDKIFIEEYTGYKDITMSDKQMEYFYSNLNENTLDCKINQYLIIRNIDNEIKDLRRWTENGYIDINKKTIKSTLFGDKIRAKDEYQKMVIDSILNNDITAISGKAGSGKTLLSLATAMSLIDSGKFDTLVVFFNPTKVRGSTDMGYYSGDMISKAMANSIGNILITKFGDRYIVEDLIRKEKLKLVSMADERGMEIKENEILYISECQNTSIPLLKLCLSRVAQNAKVIIEGDFNSQVDNSLFENYNNGMKRAIEILKGENVFGYTELKNIYRSKLAELVDKM